MSHSPGRSFLLVVALSLLLAACGSQEPTSSGEASLAPTPSAAQASASGEPSTDDATPSPGATTYMCGLATR